MQIQNTINNFCLAPIGCNAKGFLEVVRNQGAGALDGEQFMFDGIFPRRQDVYAVTASRINFAANFFQCIFKVYIGNEISNPPKVSLTLRVLMAFIFCPWRSIKYFLSRKINL